MVHRGHSYHFNKKGFTLIELLVSISIIAVLAALALPVYRSAIVAGQRADATSKLRQVGTAIAAYQGENNGRLPGPVWTGVNAWYNRNDENSFGNRLWFYLGAPEPENWSQEAKALTNPANEAQRLDAGANVYVSNGSVQIGGRKVNPWGKPNSTDPIKAALIDNPVTVWALQDADQELDEYSGASWFSRLPPAPVHGAGRVTLFFDGHVEFVSIE